MTKTELDAFFHRHHKRELVHPDPVFLLYDYEDLKEREVAALIASAVAFGRVKQILKTASRILNELDNAPFSVLLSTDWRDLRKRMSGIRHRYVTDENLADFLIGIQQVLLTYGSLEACFREAQAGGTKTVMDALTGFTQALCFRRSYLLPDPAKGSACKRLNLFLRWMVRSDEIDPGGWAVLSPADLIIPLDTHLFRVGAVLGFLTSRTPGIKAALELTDSLRNFCPSDPVRYDFTLMRLGMSGELQNFSH